MQTTTRPTKRNLSARTSVITLFLAVGVITVVELQALRIKEAKANPPSRVNAQNCLKCHSDEKTIRMMRMKEDGSGTLFNADGTFKDPKAAQMIKDFRHKNGSKIL